MFELNQQQGQKNPLQLFVSQSYTITVEFLPQEINNGRFLGGVDDGFEEFSVWYAWKSSLWSEDVKGCRV